MTSGALSGLIPIDPQAISASGDPLYYESYRPPFLPLLAILPFLLPLFWRYSVKVTKDQVVFGYSSSWTRKCVDRSMILSADPIDHVNGLLQWGGWGIRKKLGSWETGYISTNGPAVRIKTTENKAFLFNCKEPDLVCDILMSRRKK